MSGIFCKHKYNIMHVLWHVTQYEPLVYVKLCFHPQQITLYPTARLSRYKLPLIECCHSLASETNAEFLYVFTPERLRTKSLLQNMHLITLMVHGPN